MSNLAVTRWVGDVFILLGLWGIGNKQRKAFIASVLGECCWTVAAYGVTPLRRVVVEHSPALLEIIGLGTDAETGAISFERGGTTYYRARSTDRWVLFKQAVKGHGESGGRIHINDR